MYCFGGSQAAKMLNSGWPWRSIRPGAMTPLLSWTWTPSGRVLWTAAISLSVDHDVAVGDRPAGREHGAAKRERLGQVEGRSSLGRHGRRLGRLLLDDAGPVGGLEVIRSLVLSGHGCPTRSSPGRARSGCGRRPEGRETEFMALPGWARTQASSPRKDGRAERQVAPRDRRVVRLLEGRNRSWAPCCRRRRRG